jgi:predicted ferric reductase
MEAGHTYWYLTRAAGIVAYLLLFASVSLGLVMTTDLFPRRLERFRVFDLHRFVAILALALSVFHALIVLPDAFIGFTLPELMVPFASPYRATWMAAGVFALYVSVVVVASFYLRPLVPYAAWRALHYATFGVFVLAVAHGAGAGTDTQSMWARDMYAATGFVVFDLLVIRLVRGTTRGVRRPREADVLPPRPTAAQLLNEG